MQIKVEEDYDQVMIEEHLSREDATSDLTGNTSTAPLNIHSKLTLEYDSCLFWSVFYIYSIYNYVYSKALFQSKRVSRPALQMIRDNTELTEYTELYRESTLFSLDIIFASFIHLLCV